MSETSIECVGLETLYLCLIIAVLSLCCWPGCYTWRFCLSRKYNCFFVILGGTIRANFRFSCSELTYLAQTQQDREGVFGDLIC